MRPLTLGNHEFEAQTSRAYRAKVDTVNQYMRYAQLPRTLSSKLREYLALGAEPADETPWKACGACGLEKDASCYSKKQFAAKATRRQAIGFFLSMDE